MRGHPSTDIICFAYAFDGEDVALIRCGEALPERVRSHVKNGGAFVAHNAPFELAIWNSSLCSPNMDGQN
jgi:hypothetical protein